MSYGIHLRASCRRGEHNKFNNVIVREYFHEPFFIIRFSQIEEKGDSDVHVPTCIKNTVRMRGFVGWCVMIVMLTFSLMSLVIHRCNLLDLRGLFLVR